MYLQGDQTQFTEKQFTEFLLVVETSPRQLEDMGPLQMRRTGSFQLLGDVLTRFSDHCTNTVTQTSSVAKAEIQVLWTAPPAGSGCVTFKATVVENRWVETLQKQNSRKPSLSSSSIFVQLKSSATSFSKLSWEGKGKSQYVVVVLLKLTKLVFECASATLSLFVSSQQNCFHFLFKSKESEKIEN